MIRNRIGFAWLLGLLLLGSGRAGTPIQVVLLCGQSNAVGQAPTSGLPVSLQNFSDSQILIFNKGSNAVETMRLGPTQSANNHGGDNTGDASRFGPELGVALEWMDNSSAPLGVIKFAINGSSMSQPINPSFGCWDPALDGSQAAIHHFRTLMDQWVGPGLQAYQDAGYDPEVIGLLWVQGESDADQNFPTRKDTYAAVAVTFFANIRQELAIPALPIVSVRNHVNGFQFDVARFGAAWESIRRDQVVNADTDFKQLWIDSDAMGVLPDWIHYNADGQQQLGRAMVDALLQLRMPNTAAPQITQGDTAQLATLPATQVQAAFTATDGDSDSIAWSIRMAPSNGQASVSAAGMLSYTPDVGFEGTDTLEIRASDSKGGTDIIFVSIEVMDPDEDQDGMDDDWEGIHNLDDPDGDEDADGAKNLDEFKAGTDPNDANALLRILSLEGNASGEITLIWNSEQDGTAPVRTYRIVSSQNLLSNPVVWNSVTNGVSSAGVSTTFQGTVVGDRFLRVEVE